MLQSDGQKTRKCVQDYRFAVEPSLVISLHQMSKFSRAHGPPKKPASQVKASPAAFRRSNCSFTIPTSGEIVCWLKSNLHPAAAKSSGSGREPPSARADL